MPRHLSTKNTAYRKMPLISPGFLQYPGGVGDLVLRNVSVRLQKVGLFCHNAWIEFNVARRETRASKSRDLIRTWRQGSM